MNAFRLVTASIVLGMTAGQSVAGGYCGGYSYSYYYPKYIEKVVYVSQYYPAYVPTPYTTYVPPAIVPLTPLGQLTPVAAGVAPSPIAVAPIIPTAVPARPVVPVAPVGVSDIVLQKIMARLDGIEARLGNSIPPLPSVEKKELVPAPELDGLGALNLRCASCHAAEVAEQPVKKGSAKLKGGGFKMFRPKAEGKDLQAVAFTGEQIADIYDRILLPVENKDHMPPDEALKPDEGNAILKWLGALRKSAKKEAQEKDGVK